MFINTIRILHHQDLLDTQGINNFLLKVDQQPVYTRWKLLNSKSQPMLYPHFIYKYLPLAHDRHEDYLRDYLVESRLWLSSPASFNDPFDMKCRYIFEGKPQIRRNRLDKRLKQLDSNLSKKDREKRISNLLTREQPLTEKLENIHEESCNKNGVCCFSENTRNILMWSHYGSSHTGISLQFQISRDVFIFSRATKVKYEHNDEYPVINYLKDNLSASIAQTLWRKASNWSYEQERRIIHPEGANCYLQFNPSALTALILGCKLESNSENTIKTLLNERMQKNYPPVKIFRAIHDKTKYKIRFKQEHILFGS